MNSQKQTEQKIAQLAFVNRETGFRHLAYDREMLQYEYLKNGDERAIEYCHNSFRSDSVGHLSDNPLRNQQYLFVCFTTVATRFVVEGGLEPETAYNISDIYIQRADHCTTPEEVNALQDELVHYYVRLMAGLRKQNRYSKPVVLCLDYIYDHLHEPLRLEQLAEEISLNPSYLSKLFKKEVGISVSGYIAQKKVEAAENLLKYSDYSYTEIGSYLAFSSHSHFISVFKKYTGKTPKEYRQENFRISF